MSMEAFNDEMARQEYERAEHEYKTAEDMDCRTPWDIWLASWRTLRDLFACKTFVPREPGEPGEEKLDYCDKFDKLPALQRRLLR